MSTHFTKSKTPRAARGRTLRQRAKLLLFLEIDFVDSPDFRSPTAEQQISGKKRFETSLPQTTPVSRQAGLPAHFSRLCEAQLLSAQDERMLFRLVNYLKYRATVLRSQLNLDAPQEGIICEVESLLGQAKSVRDHIIHANMRLVISIVKKYVSPTVSFDELLSDGIMILMNSVEKFDYDRGFRFSTYAYRSIARNAYQQVMQRQKQLSRFQDVAETTIEGALEDSGTASMDEKTWETLSGALNQFLQKLDKRERLIVEARYALGKHLKKQTFQSIADKLGVSKERVRQLEQRAVSKLRAMANQVRVE